MKRNVLNQDGELKLLIWFFVWFFFASHDRTMQDIVYKLVPGLQEGKLRCDLSKSQFAHTSLALKKKKEVSSDEKGGGN